MLQSCLASTVALALLAAQTTSSPATNVAAVTLDVIASDAKGRVVDNLQPSDFEVIENGKPRPIAKVNLVRVGKPQPPEPTPINTFADEREAAAREGARVMAFYLDEYHVSAAATQRVRDGLTRFVEREMGFRDLALVIRPLDSLLNIRLTNDRTSLLAVINAFEGRKGDYSSRSPFEQDYFAGAPARMDAMRAQVAVSALTAMATHLGSVTVGRKALAVVSEGIPDLPRSRGDQPLPTFESVVRVANRGNVSIYAIDPTVDAAPTRPKDDRSGTPAGGVDGWATLGSLATLTDGQSTRSEPLAALQAMARDLSAYYVVTLEAPFARVATFNPVDIRVRRAGVQLRSRRGYWSPMEPIVIPDVLAARAPSSASELPRRISPLIRPWFGMARGDDESTRVSFVWEPVARPNPERGKLLVPAMISLKALDAKGTLVFEGTARAAVVGADAAAQQPPLQLAFEAPPGRLRIQMSIEDANARVIDSDVRDIRVSTFGDEVELGTARFLRTRTAREWRALEADVDAAPTAAREFSRTERLMIRVPAYGPAEGLVVTGRLVSAFRSEMRRLAATPRPGTPWHDIDVPLAGLAPGQYTLELHATSSAGEARDSLSFRVTP